MSRIRITTLVENTASGRGTRGEHGLSFWIETGGHRILFDTGQTPDVLLHNAERLEINVSSANAIVLSHGHYDHTGGLAAVLGQADRPRLLFHPAALQRRFSRHRDGAAHDVGIPAELTEARLRNLAQLTWTEAPTEIADGLHVTGEVPRETAYEDTGGDFYLDEACSQPDPIIDDQAVYFDTAAGLVVLLGCAHAGVINTLHHVRRHTADRPIHAVIGGMHLLHADAGRMEQTVSALRDLDVKRIAPTHCTGPSAAARLWSEFPDRWRPCPVGAVFEFER